MADAVTEAGWFGPRLREMRRARGWTQAHLAGLAGTTQSRIAEYERGKNSPPWSTVVALALALDTGTDAFRRPPAREPELAEEKIRNPD